MATSIQHLPEVGSRTEPAHKTLPEVLRWRAENHGNRTAFRFLGDGDTERTSWNFGELYVRANAVACSLAAQQKAGDRTLLVFPPGLDFIAALLGCMYARTIPVLVQPPQQARLAAFVSRASAIWRDAEPSLALTNASVNSMLGAASPEGHVLSSIKWIAMEDALLEPAPELMQEQTRASDIALLQYTSGSTTEPRGVVITHQNLASNLALIRDSFEQPSGSESVSWLPPYHDMGLIGGILAPIFLGTTATLMSPASFIQRPLRWLAAIARYRASVSGGPNFAYDLCVQRVTPEQRDQLDLSSWEVAFNGAEPVNARTLRDFGDFFATSGFSRAAFKPCYGLAEATLLVAAVPNPSTPLPRTFLRADLARNKATPCSETSEASQLLTSCGFPVATLVVVDPDTGLRCDDGVVGELWAAGESVARGYWNRPLESLNTFGAQISANDPTHYLRTGDLGFLLDGELFITGRLKDLIIVDGFNHYPHDIEATVAECHPSLQGADCVAFSIDGRGREEVIVIAAARGRMELTADELRIAIRTAVARTHDIRLHDIALVRPGSLPKTTSGKIRRHLCKLGYEARTLAIMEKQ